MDIGYWLDVFEGGIERVEAVAVDLVARLAPWVAPAPTAYLVFSKTVEHLHWPAVVGGLAALVIEGLGLAVTATLMDLYRYNTTRRKSDPKAPMVLPVVLVGVYFASAELLTVVLDVTPKLTAGLGVRATDCAPAVFPVLSLAGVATLALRADHRRRLEAIEDVKRERRAARRAAKSGTKGGTKVARAMAQIGTGGRPYSRVSEATREQARAILAERPGISGSELGRLLGRSERLGRKLKAELTRGNGARPE